MTKSQIQTALDQVPPELVDAGPSELKTHFEKTIQGITPDEANSLTALHIVNHLGDTETLMTAPSPWATIGKRLQSKYQELDPSHPLWKTLEICAVAVLRNKIVIVFN